MIMIALLLSLRKLKLELKPGQLIAFMSSTVLRLPSQCNFLNKAVVVAFSLIYGSVPFIVATLLPSAVSSLDLTCRSACIWRSIT